MNTLLVTPSCEGGQVVSRTHTEGLKGSSLVNPGSDKVPQLSPGLRPQTPGLGAAQALSVSRNDHFSLSCNRSYSPEGSFLSGALSRSQSVPEILLPSLQATQVWLG